MSKSVRFPTPQPKQVEFCKSRARFTCYGGARGGGKSWVIRFKAKLLALHYAGIRICIVRKTLEDLRTALVLDMNDCVESDYIRELLGCLDIDFHAIAERLMENYWN